MKFRIATIVALAVGLLLLTGCGGPPSAEPSPKLVEETPPCAPIQDPSDDPCEPRTQTETNTPLTMGGADPASTLSEPLTSRELPDGPLNFPPDVALRPTYTPNTEYLTEEIPPCAPIQGSDDPCGPYTQAETHIPLTMGGADPASTYPEPLTVREFLDGGSLISIAHVVLRGTYTPDTVRCTAGNDHRPPSYEETGYFQNSLLLKCYADVQVRAYILGSGPQQLTVQIFFYHYFGGFLRSFEYLGTTTEPEAEEIAYNALESTFEVGQERAGGISGREVILFIGPAHDQGAEVWQVFETWGMETNEEGTVVAVHPHRWSYKGNSDYEQHRSALEMELPAFTQAVTDAHQARVTAYGGRIAPADIDGRAAGVELPMLVTDANQLSQFYTSTGAFNHPDGPPTQPPAPYVCANDTAVSDSGFERGLVHDCEGLLEAKDTLRGTATLNWSVNSAITTWEGVTTATIQTRSRVTKLELPNESLNGSIPSGLGSLFKVTHFDLSGNSLTGEIPHELGWLQKLETLKLSGNTLTGCIPVALEYVPINDLFSLNLLYCQPPAPEGLAGTAGETSMALSWNTVSNTSKYRVEYRLRSPEEWTLASDTLTGTSHTVSGLDCGSEYQFRVGAYGSGAHYASEWSEWSDVLTLDTTECLSPVFDEESYSFDAAPNAATGTSVGTVSATDPNGDNVTYSITAGSGTGKFTSGSTTGEITVASALDGTVDSYTLTVQATDGTNSSTVEVVINLLSRAPAFDHSSYSFTVSEDAALDHEVGTVTATDADMDTLTYSITTGNGDGKFAIDDRSGRITLDAALDHEDTDSYTLTVQVDDGRGKADMATVDITVSDVPEDLPPAPTGVGVTLTSGTFTITWDAVTGTDNYEVEYRTGGEQGIWTSAGTSATTSLTYAPADLPCGTTYDFQVRAHGDGVVYVADWGGYSDSDSVSTEACNQPPDFEQEAYTFSVAEDAEVRDVVGTVSATDTDSNNLYYLIISGNGDRKFAIAVSSGRLIVYDSLDYEATPSYTLTVRVSDQHETMEETDTTTVTINVTDVPEELAPGPTDFSVSLADGTFTTSWSAVPGTNNYEVQYRVGGDGRRWWSAGTTTTTGLTYTPSGILTCGTYDFRVRAHGDRVTYADDWGTPSEIESVEGRVCPQPPEFDHDSYALTISDDTAISTSVGGVSATDPDAREILTYSIVGGNEESKFAVNLGTGTIRVAGALDYGTKPEYTLTFQVEDTAGGTDTTTVIVTLTMASCSSGTVVPNPGTNPNLVRDCSILLTAKDELAGDATLNWSADLAIGSWQGITLGRNPSQHVRQIAFTDAGLTGTIPASLGGLADLHRLELDRNELTGSIPAELGQLSKLHHLYLQRNGLTGSIPADLGELDNLRYMQLYNNGLTGRIPTELGNMDNLQELYLDNNQLTGGIPTELGSVDSLTRLYLRNNRLGGAIPSELEGLDSLDQLYLFGNDWSGCIPAGLEDVENNDLDLLFVSYCRSS